MNEESEKIFGRSKETLREMHRYRTLSNPSDGNRTTLAISLCVLLLAVLSSSSVWIQWAEVHSLTMNPIPFVYLHRHIIAVIAIFMFLLMDGSPETLALGLFFGFESVSYLCETFPTRFKGLEFLGDFTFEMALVFKLYFSCQMARVFPKHLAPWTKWGATVSIVYAFGMSLSPFMEGLLSLFLKNMSELVIGIGGGWLCLRVAEAISKDRVPWRVWALVIAGFAFFQAPIEIIVDVWFEGNPSIPVKVGLEMYRYAALVSFTLAAFVNISTMENRIQALSKARSRQRLEKMREEQRVHEAIAKTTQMLAHDVRKPFNLIKVYANSLQDASSTDDAKRIVKRMMPDIQKSLKIVDEMISNIMDIGRDLPLHMKPVAVQQLIGKCLEQVFQVGLNPNIHFKYHFRHRGKIIGDEAQLIRVISNILENAEQAISGRSEQITISTFNDAGAGGERISIEITNSGSFIPREDLKNIFDAFFTKGKENGTGLGLAIVKKVIRMHGGEVSVTSSAKSGTSFRFLLPARYDAADDRVELPRNSGDVKINMSLDHQSGRLDALSTESEHLHWVYGASSQLEIAIIEDDLIFAEHLEKQLHEFRVHFFSNPDDFTKLEANQAEVLKRLTAVITDMHFAGYEGTGTDIAKLVRSRLSIPVILFSNQHPNAVDHNQFDGVISKDGKEAQTIVKSAVLKKKSVES